MSQQNSTQIVISYAVKCNSFNLLLQFIRQMPNALPRNILANRFVLLTILM